MDMNNDNYLRFKELKLGDMFIVASHTGEINLDTAIVYVKVIDNYGECNAADIRCGGMDYISDNLPVIRVARVNDENKWKIIKE